jgi:hypothetical protein
MPLPGPAASIAWRSSLKKDRGETVGPTTSVVIAWEYLVVHGGGQEWVTSDPGLDLDDRPIDQVIDAVSRGGWELDELSETADSKGNPQQSARLRMIFRRPADPGM